MRQPRLAGIVERRLLVNYRADPAVTAALLPAPLRPHLVGGAAVVGVCLLRLGHLRPLGWPAAVGVRSESAAHRIAVEWDGGRLEGGTLDGDGGPHRGVYIPRRDSNALLSVVTGGRLFPGVHHRATFTVTETAESFQVAFAARDGSAWAAVDASLSPTLGGQLFSGVDEASAFFQAGAIGLSPPRAGSGLEGIELRTDRWAVEPVTIHHAESSFFGDAERFPRGSVELDCGLIMRQLPVTLAPVRTVSHPAEHPIDVRVGGRAGSTRSC